MWAFLRTAWDAWASNEPANDQPGIYIMNKYKFLLLFISLIIFSDCSKKKSTVELYSLKIAENSPLKTEIIITEQIQPEIKSFGNISFSKKTDITPLVEGTIQSIYVEEGDSVTKGQLLAELENLQLMIQYQQSNSALRSAKASFKLTKTRYEEAIRQGEARFLSLEKRQIQLNQKEKELEEMSRNIENKRSLLEVDGIPGEEFHNMALSYERALTDYILEEIDFEINSIGFRDKDIEAAGIPIPKDEQKREELLILMNTQTLEAELESAEAGLESSTAELQALELLIERLKIISPGVGILGAKYMEEGERVPPNTTLFTIFDSRNVYAIFPVQEKEAGRLLPGQEVLVTVPALGGKELSASLQIISPTIDPQSGNLQVKALLKNANGVLLPGMFAQMRLITGIPENMIFVNEDAFFELSRDKGDLFIVKNNTLFKVSCQLGINRDGKIRIIDGLKEGDRVVIDPAPFLKEGMEITILEED
jgi:HlyD family secretion protein